jgi:predicted aspartyl protease
MYRALALLWCSVLAAADIAQLQQFTGNNRMFELRRALDGQRSDSEETVFYRAIIACRFGREADGIALLQKFLATNPSPEMARNAHEEIAEASERLGRYRVSEQEWAAALQQTPSDDPDREENGNTRALMASLSDTAPQTVDFGEGVPVQATRNRVGSWNVPLRVNGVIGQWIFDSGANISTLSESEAKHMGVAVRESSAWVAGSTDKRSPLHIAVAGDLQFGSAHVHNVVFLVLADQSLYIAPLHYQITGILGLPVLRALGRVGITSAGVVRIHPPEPVPAGMPNLFFDGDSPIVQVHHDQHRLQLFLDTGANETTLYPSFRSALNRDDTARMRTRKEKTAGAGGGVQRGTDVVPALQISILDTPVGLRKLSLLREMPKGDARFRDGVVGMDALWSGFLLDFEAMRLEVFSR